MRAAAGSRPQNAVLREGRSEIVKKLQVRLSRTCASLDLLRNLLRRYRDLGYAFVPVRDERPVGKAKLHDIGTRDLLQRRHCRKRAHRLWRQLPVLTGYFLS